MRFLEGVPRDAKKNWGLEKSDGTSSAGTGHSNAALIYQKNGAKVLVLNKERQRRVARFVMHGGHCTRLIGEPEVIVIDGGDVDEVPLSKLKIKRMGGEREGAPETRPHALGRRSGGNDNAGKANKRMRGVMQGEGRRAPIGQGNVRNFTTRGSGKREHQ